MAAGVGHGHKRGFLREEIFVHLDAGVKDLESGLILGVQEGEKPWGEVGWNWRRQVGTRISAQACGAP